MAGQSLFRTTLALKGNIWDTTLTLATVPTVTSGRIRIFSSTTEELISYTGVSGSTITGITGGLSLTADPSTGSSGITKTWLAGTQCEIVWMHDQFIDKQKPEIVTFATTAARDTALGGNGVATKAYFWVYVTATGLYYNYNLSTAQWEAIDTGTVTPNASLTVTGKTRLGSSAQTIAGTDDDAWNPLVARPSDIAKNTQSWTFVYTSSADVSDTYTANLTPALTAYTTGQRVRVKFTTANTGACTLNLNSLGAKSIKTRAGNDPSDGDIAAGSIREFIYDGTNFILDYNQATTAEPGSVEMATDAEAYAATDTTRYVNPFQASNKYATAFTTTSVTLNNTNTNLQTSTAVASTKGCFTDIRFQWSYPASVSWAVTLTFQYSPDNSNWTTVYSVSVAQSGWVAWSYDHFMSYMMNPGTYLRGTVQTNSTNQGSAVVTIYSQERQ